MNSPYILTCSLFLYAFHRCIEAYNSSLLDGIFPPDYVDETIPIYPNGTAATVYINIEVIQAGSISETNKEFSLGLFLFERWADWRLRPLQNLSQGLVLPPSVAGRIWQPVLDYDHAKSSRLEDNSRHLLLLDDDQLLRVSRYSFKIHCEVDLTLFPLDSQECPFSMRSLSTFESALRLRWIHESGADAHKAIESIRLQQGSHDVRFSLDVPVASRTTIVLARGKFSVLHAQFTFHRELTSRVLKTYLPSSLLVMMSWAGFWIDVTAVPGRVSLGVTSVLTIVTQISQSFDVTYMNALDLWLFACEIMVISAVLEFVIAYTLAKTGSLIYDPAKRASKAYDVPSPENNEAGGARASVAKIRVRKNTFRQLVDEVMMRNIKSEHRNYVDRVARVAFPVTFAIFAVVYWAVLVYYGVYKKRT
ncbi:glycine receptor subunit alpha-2-like [Haemaphysalis longicornis]